jgi:hypothetical protein
MSYTSVRVQDSIISTQSLEEGIQSWSRHDSDWFVNYDVDGFIIDYSNPIEQHWQLPTIDFPYIDTSNYKMYDLPKADFGHFTSEMMRKDFSIFSNIVNYELGRQFSSGFDFCSSSLTYSKDYPESNMWHYVTTSGTILFVSYDSYQVYLPNHRIGGTTYSNLEKYLQEEDNIQEELQVSTVQKTIPTRRGSKYHTLHNQRAIRSKDRTNMRTNNRNAKYTLLELV